MPEKEEILKAIAELKRSNLCADYFGVHQSTFIRWLKKLEINHNFHKTLKGAFVGKKHTQETKDKISKTKISQNKKGPVLERVKTRCSICSKKFITVPTSNHRSLNKKFCSKECSFKNKSIERSKLNSKINKHCFYCNKEIEIFPCNQKEYNFCSKTCFYKNNTGKTLEERYGEEKAYKIKIKIAKAAIENNKNMPLISKPHLLFKEKMIEHGIYNNFQTSQRLYYFEIDELNEVLKICIEIDGDYWHSLPKRIEKDINKDNFLFDHDYIVIRIKECDVYNNIDQSIQQVKNIIYQQEEICL